MKSISYRAVILSLLCLQGASGQGTPPVQPSPFASRPERGTMPFALLAASDVDSVDTTTGNLSLTVPLASLPLGRAGQKFGISLMYNSAIYDLQSQYESAALSGGNSVPVLKNRMTGSKTGGWKYNFRNIGLDYEERATDPIYGSTCPTNGVAGEEGVRIYRLRVGLGDGSQHIMHLRGNGNTSIGGIAAQDGFYAYGPDGKRSPCATLLPAQYPSNLSGVLTYYSSDASYLKLEINTSDMWSWQIWRLYLPDGSRILGKGPFAEAIDDPDGNRVAIYDECVESDGGNPPSCYEIATYIENVVAESPTVSNALTRKIEIRYNHPIPNNSTQDLIRYRGFGQGPDQVLTTRVNWQQFNINPNPTQAQTLNYTCWRYGSTDTGTCSLANFTHRVVSSVELPIPNRSYSFSYLGWANGGMGELGSMTTPTGAQYSYVYETEGQPMLTSYVSIANPVRRRRMIGGGHDLTWQYLWENAKTTVSGPDGETRHFIYDKTGLSNPFKGRSWKTELPTGEVIERQWAQNPAFDVGSSVTINNPWIFDERRSYLGMSSRTAYQIDRNGNRRKTAVFDWVQAPDATGAELRTETTLYQPVDKVPNWRCKRQARYDS